MTFGEAVKAGFDNYANFKGRTPRSGYWWWTLFYVLLVVAAVALSVVSTTLYYVAIALITLGLFIPNIAVSVRRLHDTGRSGWWYLISFIPLIGGLVLLVFFVIDSDDGENEYGPSPKAGSGQGSTSNSPPLPPSD